MFLFCIFEILLSKLILIVVDINFFSRSISPIRTTKITAVLCNDKDVYRIKRILKVKQLGENQQAKIIRMICFDIRQFVILNKKPVTRQ